MLDRLAVLAVRTDAIVRLAAEGPGAGSGRLVDRAGPIDLF
ncbi:hypothetical protein ACIRPQ_14125 [Streptomyces sp. NPDC101213]